MDCGQIFLGVGKTYVGTMCQILLMFKLLTRAAQTMPPFGVCKACSCAMHHSTDL